MDTKNKIYSSRKIYELLELVRQRPYVLLTSKSIVALQNFLNGYLQLGFADDIYHPGEPDFDTFKYWILDKDGRGLGVKDPYSTFLLHECNGDEERAFDRFFDYLEKFKMEHYQGKET